MAETRGSWTDLVPGVGLDIAEVFDQGQEEYLPGIFSVLSTSTAAVAAEKNIRGKTGAGRLKLFNDGDDLADTRRYPSYLTKVIYNNYGVSMDVTKNQIDDREFMNELDEMKDLSIGANFSQDEAGMQLFNGGFATTATVNGYVMNFYGDAVPTYSTVHPTQVPGGSTQSNASATGIKFGHDQFETAKVALVEQKTDDGIPMALMGKITVSVSPQLEKEVTTEANSVLNPETANNAINVFNGVFDVAVSTFLGTANSGSDTQWFATIPGRDKQYHEVRQSAHLEQATNIRNKVVTFTVDARWANYVKDWRRKWGSKGDGLAYSS